MVTTTGTTSTTNTTTTTTAASAPLIAMESFDKKKLKWSRWVDRFELMLSVSGIPEQKKLTFLLHYMGQDAYNTVCDKLAPEKPSDSNYETVVETLEQFYEPKPLELVENFKFHKRYQLDNETVEEYLTTLRKLAIHCNFGTYLDTALRNQFVFGLKSSAAQKRCLEKKELKLNDAYEIALAAEMAEKGGAEIQSTQASSSGVHKIQKTVSTDKKSKCYRCGRTNHSADVCKFKTSVCNGCGKTGHIERACLSKSKQESKAKAKKKGDKAVKNVEELDFSHIEILNVNNVNSICSKTLNFVISNVKVAFEVDTGSPVSIIGKTLYQRSFSAFKLESPGIGLRSFSNAPLKILGTFWVNVEFKGNKNKLKLFVVNLDKNPIVGRDWISALKPDLNSLFVNGIGMKLDEDYETELGKLREKYANVFGNDLGKITGFQARIHIKPNTKPVFIKHRSVPLALREAVNKELDTLVESGVLEKVQHSQWATPIVPVRKADGRVRVCGDYKLTVNPNIVRKHYPLPTIDEMFNTDSNDEEEGGSDVRFTKLDLRHAYLQTEVHPDDREILTLSTHKGLYRPTRYMFGIANGPEDWQSFIDQVFGDMQDVVAFFDDLMIKGKNAKKHIETLDEVLRRLSKNNMRLNLGKCEFFKESIKFCGYEIDKNGLHKQKEKMEAINAMPQPENKDQVRSFVGLVNYYGRFFKNLSSILFPLNNLLKKDVKFVWDAKCQESFEKVKEEMQTERVLVKYNPKLPLVLACDASPYGVGAVISHVLPDGTEKPIKFASKTLSPVQQRYSQIDREAYGVIFGVKYFHDFLYGRKFTLCIDNKALSQILNPAKGLSTLSLSRMQHYAIFLQNYDFIPKFRGSEQHANADAMSRLPLKGSSEITMDEIDCLQVATIETLPITVEELSSATAKDNTVKELIEGLKHGREVRTENRFGVDQMEFSLQKGCLMRGIRPFIPKALRERVLNELHDGHFGICRMKSLARSYCWWPKIDSDIEVMTQSCIQCQTNRPNPSKAPIHSWEPSKKVFERIHVDYAGPFNGKFFFILVDSFSKWPEITVVPNMTTETTINCCMKIFSTHGFPEVLVSDHGTQFTSREFQDFLKNCGIQHKMGAPYHPATNGLAERMVGTMKQKLKSLNCSPNEYEKAVCNLLLSYRKTVHPSTGQSPSMMVFKRQIRSRLDIMIPQDTKDQTKEPEKQVRDIAIGSRVTARDYRHPKETWAMGKITKKLGKLHYMVSMDNGLTWKRHIDQLRQIGEKPNGKEANSSNSNINAEDSDDEEIESMRIRNLPISFHSSGENSNNPIDREFNSGGEDSDYNSNRNSNPNLTQTSHSNPRNGSSSNSSDNSNGQSSVDVPIVGTEADVQRRSRFGRPLRPPHRLDI